MSKNVMVIAPHPDDETLGCGGTILKHKSGGDRVHWLIATGLDAGAGFGAEMIIVRNQEIAVVSSLYEFDSTTCLNLPPARLDIIPMCKLVAMIGEVIGHIGPEILYIPFPGDIHSDHRIVFQAAAACSKWFRFGSIRRVLAYETLSETDFAISPETNAFNPNVYVDIGEFLKKKLKILRTYKSELGSFPFPRSEKAVAALAQVRGAAAGCRSAEAFMLLKAII